MTVLSIRSYFAMLLLAAIGGCNAATDADEPSVELGSAASALRYSGPEVPAALAVPAGHRFAFYMDAEGEQLYACRANATGGYSWTFVAPVADLFKPNGRFGGTHYAGPTWEYLDGSTVVGAVVARHVEDPATIPWLLLNATAHAGDGKMSSVSYIHRLETSGGLAPSTGCDADHLGAEIGVAYTATYYFYAPSSCSH
jgi:hypothetical protein